MKHLLLLFILLILTPVTKAAIIQQTDGSLNWQYDDVSNLQWLDLTHTDGLSLDSALSAYGSSGWVIANGDQFRTMYHSNYDMPNDGSLFGFSSGYTHDATVGTDRVSDVALFDTSYLNHFAQDFGLTHSSNAQGYVTDLAYGFYLDAGEMNLGGVYQAIEPGDITTLVSYNNYLPDYTNLYYAANDFGVFMVRETPQNVVPVPPAVWLFGSGIMGLIGLARRKKA